MFSVFARFSPHLWRDIMELWGWSVRGSDIDLVMGNTQGRIAGRGFISLNMGKHGKGASPIA
jgi:hypothetical protein